MAKLPAFTKEELANEQEQIRQSKERLSKLGLITRS